MDKHQELAKLNQLQLKALYFVAKKSKLYHNNCKELLRSKLMQKGLNDDEIKKLYDMVVNDAPLVTHFRASLLCKLASDTCVRNVYEVNEKGSCYLKTRTGWENHYFNNIYENASSTDKPKYASINFTKNPAGITTLSGYGSSYIKYKNCVKNRTSFIFDDCNKMDLHIASFSYFAHILYYMNESLLNDLIKIVKGEIKYSRQSIVPYVGAHIHGLVLIDEDIEAIYINNSEASDEVKTAASEFYQNHPKVEIIFFS
jgi:hypothetical protein